MKPLVAHRLGFFEVAFQSIRSTDMNEALLRARRRLVMRLFLTAIKREFEAKTKAKAGLVLARLESMDPVALSRNAEVFPLIARLAQTHDSTAAERIFNKILLMTGDLDWLEQPATLPNGACRLTGPANALYFVENGKAQRVDVDAWERLDGGLGIFYPFSGLFSDFLPADTYPADRRDRFAQRDGLKDRIIRGLQLLNAYSRYEADRVYREISWIALQHPDTGKRTRSYSYMENYFGTIFVNPYYCNDLELAAAMIHETFHMQFVLWWTDDRPVGAPDISLAMTSTRTGKERAVLPMVHALAILAEHFRFYRWATEVSCVSENEREFARTESAKISALLPILHADLSAIIPRESEVARMLAAIANAATPK